MKRHMLTAAAAAALFFAPAAALAQVQGGLPGFYDLSGVQGWIADPESLTTEGPSWYPLDSDGQVRSTGSSCNIISEPIILSEDLFASGILSLGAENYAEIMRSQGTDVEELGPLVTFDADGIPAVRFLMRTNYSGVILTLTMVQLAPGGNIVNVTCGSIEGFYGADAPTLERFIDQVRFTRPTSAAKVSRGDEDATPIRAVAAIRDQAGEIAGGAALRGILNMLEATLDE